ncbi:hypothetical protein VTK26DRAFT_6743 [Humicola hyalothermophila]
MHFSIATVLAFTSAVFAQGGPTDGFNAIVKPTKGENVPAGSTYKIEWQYNEAFPGTVSIGLLGGSSPSTLSVVDSIATGVDATEESFDWEVPEDAGDLATYGIMITLESDPETFQYGFPFQITPLDDSDDESSTSTAATSTSTSTETETETSAEPTTKSTSTSSSTTVAPPTTAPGNSSVTTSSAVTAPTTTLSTTVIEDGPTATTTPPVEPNGAASMTGSFAMLGGLAMAILAL